jgi:hypothetical protein
MEFAVTNPHKIRQLKSLVRFRQLQQDKSAKKLAVANMELAEAREAVQVSQARYQLVVEMQRKFRQAGFAINPLSYNHQLDAADTAKHFLDESVAIWNQAKMNKSASLNDFSLRHCQLNVAQNAKASAIAEYRALQEKSLLNDCSDQQSKISTSGWDH